MFQILDIKKYKALVTDMRKTNELSLTWTQIFWLYALFLNYRIRYGKLESKSLAERGR